MAGSSQPTWPGLAPGERIRLRIAPDGSIVAETLGITGAKCVEVIPMLEELLEAQTVESAFTADYNTATQMDSVDVDDELHH
ncbi:MAG: DUF2997 domain-containing protein [Bifidobacteriaceae bacterium]|jgi:hypothetical protein|nr:DUF2997 domain-containing protein [Bifidobacteriaceae bacterium]